MHYSYILWLAVFVATPLIIELIVFRKTLRTYHTPILLAPIGALVFSFPWDYISIQENIWYFREPYIAGIWLFGLPIEEWLFITLVTLLFATTAVIVWSRYGKI